MTPLVFIDLLRVESSVTQLFRLLVVIPLVVFTNSVETRLIRGGGQTVIRRLLRHNAIEAWETMQKSGGWKRCPPKW